jgi:hypothetical protein
MTDPFLDPFLTDPFPSWLESVGITHAPLTPGKHTFALHAVNTQSAFGAFFEYNNTWTVTVGH